MYKPSKYNLVVHSDINNIVLYNTSSGSLCKFNTSTNDYIKTISKNVDFSKHQYFKDILNQGFIIDEKINEFNLLNEKRLSAIYDSDPYNYSYIISVTSACNYRCSYCFTDLNNISIDQETSDAIISFIDKNIKRNNQTRSLHITWFGGEPLLEYETIYNMSLKLVSICTLRGITYSASLVTNGYFLDYLKLKELDEKCYVRSVQVTLDGLADSYSKRKGTVDESFNRVQKNIVDGAKIDDIVLTVRINVDRENISEAWELSDLLLVKNELCNKINIYISNITDDNNCIDCSYANNLYNNRSFSSIISDFACYIGDKNKSKDIRYYISSPRSINCSMQVKSNFSIGPNGKLYKCIKDVGYPDRVIGDVFNGRYFNAHEMKYLSEDVPVECKDCVLFPMCAGGCRFEYLKDNTISCRIDVDSTINILKRFLEYRRTEHSSVI